MYCLGNDRSIPRGWGYSSAIVEHLSRLNPLHPRVESLHTFSEMQCFLKFFSRSWAKSLSVASVVTEGWLYIEAASRSCQASPEHPSGLDNYWTENFLLGSLHEVANTNIDTSLYKPKSSSCKDTTEFHLTQGTLHRTVTACFLPGGSLFIYMRTWLS